ncbi:MAG: class I SAM-dependent methyltransferase [Pseudomonadota bacterium]
MSSQPFVGTEPQRLVEAEDVEANPELIKLAVEIEKRTGRYSGGPVKSFEAVGRDALATLLSEGLLPSHKLLDFGCGSLRLGYWLIRFLDEGCYFGIEPFRKGVEAGLELGIGEELQEFKRPRFSFSNENNFGVFDEQFDYVIARSILTHTAPGMLTSILKSFRTTCPAGVFLASYWREDSKSHYHTVPNRTSGIEAVGDSLDIDDQRFIAVVRYTFAYIEAAARSTDLAVEELNRPTINKQIWLKFTPI